MENLDIKVITGMAKKEIVNKDYQLINARYKLSSNQMKIILKVIALINNKEDSDFLIYQIPLSFFSFLTDNNNHQRIRQECKILRAKELSIEVDGVWIETGWFSGFRFDTKTQVIEASIDPFLKPYLLQLKSKFKYYELKYLMKMDSEYAMRIYELCKQYELIKKREFELTELHELMQVPVSYISKFKDFRVKVLDIAVREINKHSDLKISYEAKKRGRAVFWIEFTIEKNEKNIIESEAFENKIIFNEVKHKNFKILFKKFNFADEEFIAEFENFCLYNNEDEEKITDDNFKKWCMQKKRKIVENENKNLGIQEQKQYAWDFKKAKDKSDKIKDFLDFDLGVDWLNIYYLKDIKTFEVVFKNEVVKIGWQDVMHPHFDKEEILLFRIYDDVADMTNEERYLLENNSVDVIEVE